VSSLVLIIIGSIIGIAIIWSIFMYALGWWYLKETLIDKKGLKKIEYISRGKGGLNEGDSKS